MKQHLRVVVEVAVLGTLVMSVPLLAMFASVPILNFFGGWWIDLSFLMLLGTVIVYVLPFAAAFYDGYRRKLQLRFLAVGIGWIIGGYGSGAFIMATLLRHAKIPYQKPLTPWLWVNWLIWLGLVLVPVLLFVMVTMWGQRVRLRARQ